MIKTLFKFIGLTLLMPILLLFIAILIVPAVDIQAQQLPESKQQHPEIFEYYNYKQKSIDSLEAIHGKNKTIAEEVKLASLLALSFYPELKDVNIEFILESELFPYSSRPTVASFFKKERKYTVRISNSLFKAFELFRYDHVPLNALVGVLGHELAHVWYYEQVSKAALWNVAIHYVVPSFSRDWENLTDKIAIHHGLGYQILAWAEYGETVFGKSEKKEKERYMSVPSILEYLELLEEENANF